ncbi:8346_t:CDS:2 [Funneliformis mosseae]|uniref:8346_t:CDS:1 n=1 Tax=Funneliformis mosseae TaxID=27381 RepID=A0A9N9G121_FUNMO|nr:8346_t:CDS:2 [Funneliformis mosseae]
MSQKRANKEQRLHKTFNPVFTNASAFYHSQKIPEITTSIQDTLNPSSSTQISKIQEKLTFYCQKAMITDSKLIEQQVCEYIAQMTKKTSGEYKANSVKQAVDAIKHHLVKVSSILRINLYNKYEFSDLFTVLHSKIKDFQEKRFDEKEGSMALTAQQVQEILADDFLNSNTPKGLLYHVFFRIATNFAFRGGEHYNLHYEIEGGAAQNIHLSPNSESANNIKKIGLNILVDANVLEDAIIEVTGHKSI